MRKEEKERLINQLGEAKLKWPKGLKKFIFHETNYRINATNRARYVNTLEMFNGRLLMRTFAYRSSDKRSLLYKNMEVQEVCRRLEGLSVVLLCQIEACGIYGNRIPYFTDTGRWISKKDSVWNSWYVGGKRNWWFTYDAWEMYDTAEMIKKLNVPYCAYLHKKNVHRLPFFEHYEIYRKYPKIELLIKAGYSNFVPYARFLNMKGKNFEQIFKIDKYWQEEIQYMDFNQYQIIKKYQLHSQKELIVIEESRILDAMKGRKVAIEDDILKIARYILKKNISSLDYLDYIKFSKEIGADLKNKKVLFPENFKEEHDRAEEMAFCLRNKAKDEAIKKRGKELEKYTWASDQYLIKAPQNAQEFVNESQELHHCVRSYIERHANGGTNIMFVRKSDFPDKPYVTLEFKNRRVIQVRADHNRLPEANTLEFVRKWAKKMKIKYEG